MNFSVLMAIYAGENPQNFEEALESSFNQTLVPTEFVLVKDGPLTQELDAVVNKFTSLYSEMVVVELEKNQGLGIALNEGLKVCSYDLVARADSDDRSLPNRFERQIEFMGKNPYITIVGSNIIEYDEEMKNQLSQRKVPEKDQEIKSRIKKQSPFNHVTVMYKKDKVIEAGGYLDCPYFEDYYLWCRMIAKGGNFYNIQESFVDVRGGDSMISRRGGIKYIKHIWNFYMKTRNLGIFSLLDVCKGLFIRSLAAIAPRDIRSMYYKKVLRRPI
jgi:glycosyltransferase involved in cell wall biosynthesis